MNHLFVGLDVSSEKLDTCFLTDDLTVLHEEMYPNDTNGAQLLKEKVLKLHQEFSFSKIVIGMESTSMYSFHPAMFFQKDEQLQAIGVVTTIEDPHRIKQFTKMFDKDKTDAIDAFMIADYLRIQRYVNSPIREEKYMALQRLTRTRFQLVKQMVEVKQHFIENVTYKCNTLSRELRESEVSTTLFSATIMDLLTQDMTLDEMAALPLEEFAALLQTKGRGRFKNPEELAKTIKKAIRSSYRLGKVMDESIDIVLGILVREIRALKEIIDDIEKAIIALVEIIPEFQCLTSIPGVGLVYAAGMLAEIGQIERFEDQTKLAKYAGLSWKRSQSGRRESQHTPLTKKGNRYFRYYLVEAANSVRRHLPEYRAFYQKKYAETPKHQHKRAIVLTARKFVRLVDTLLRNHQLYTPPRSVRE